MRTPILLTLAFGLVLAGFALVLAGNGFSAGCFFWPFPIIIACGAGSGGTPSHLIIVGLLAVVLISFLFFFWMRKAVGDSTIPSEEESGGFG